MHLSLCVCLAYACMHVWVCVSENARQCELREYMRECLGLCVPVNECVHVCVPLPFPRREPP